MTKRLITCADCGKTECVCGSENWRVSRTPESAGSVSALVQQKDDQIKELRKRNDWLHNKMLTYLVEIQKCNKGLRRLNRRLGKKQNV